MTRTFVFLIGLGLVLGAGGCGRQDRYEVVAPGLPGAMPVVEWEGAEELSVPQFVGTCRALGAWAQDDLLMVDGDGRVLWVHGPELRQVPPVADVGVVGLVVRPDGSAECLDSDGACHTWSAGAWQPEPGPGACLWQGLLEDDRGRLTAFAWGGCLVRREAGAWQPLSMPDSLDFCSAWAAPGGNLNLVTRSGEIVRENEGSWTIQPLPWFGTTRITGNGDGRLAVWPPYGREFWLFDGTNWLPQDLDFYIADLFYLDDQLFCIRNYPGGLLRWTDGAWQEFESGDFWETFESTRSFPGPDGRILVGTDGPVGAFDGESCAVLTAPLGELAGAAVFEERLNVILRRGAHLVQVGDHWERLGNPISSAYSNGALGVDPAGNLLIFATDAVCRFRDGAYETLWGTAAPDLWSSSWRIDRVFGQGDGTYLIRDYDRIALADERGVVELEPLPLFLTNVIDLQRDPAGGYWILESWRLTHSGATGAESPATFSSWWATGLHLDPQLGLLVFGNARVMRPKADGWVDLSPWRDLRGSLAAVAVRDMCGDGRGRCLAWSSAGYLLFDGREWSLLESTQDDPMPWNYSYQLLPQVDGSVLVLGNYGTLFRIRPEVLP